MKLILSLAIAFASALSTVDAASKKPPNILWISAEDISPHLACLGDPHAITPHLDQLASEGVRYTRTFTTAGVCAPCRSGIITGMYQTTLGTHHMRCSANLPPQIRPFPAYLRELGYYTSNKSKQDYQFKTPKDVWDESGGKAHWRRRKNKDQPFFSVFNFTGCHESGIASAGKLQDCDQGPETGSTPEPGEAHNLPSLLPKHPVRSRRLEAQLRTDHGHGCLGRRSDQATEGGRPL